MTLLMKDACVYILAIHTNIHPHTVSLVLVRPGVLPMLSAKTINPRGK